jgi:hypothetical protein
MSRQFQFARQIIDERPKADALNDTAELEAQAFDSA